MSIFPISSDVTRIHPSTAVNTFTPLASGLTEAFDNEYICHTHTVQSSATGSPTSYVVNLQGSLDGVTYFAISDNITVTGSNGLFHVVTRAVRFIKANVVSVSGGTSPLVTFMYAGAR